MSAAAAVRLVPIASGSTSAKFQRSLGDLLATYMAAFDVLGRLHVLQNAKAKTGRELKLNTISSQGAQFAEVLGFTAVPFEGAIRRLRNLTPMTRAAFDGLRQQYKMQAFTVAGTSDVRLIDGIHKALTDIVASGQTEQDFKTQVQQLATDAGVADLSAFAIETVFHTNVQTAYQNGRFEQMRDPAVAAALPYWQYNTVGDDRVRPAHAALDGFVAHNQDPVWRRIYPPSGFNCRCSVSSMTADEAPDDADVPGLSRLPVAAASVPDPGFGGRA
jgi:SPP1 gp7 family putative phage head morphogenesis protein